jgi:hypothetical protein
MNRLLRASCLAALVLLTTPLDGSRAAASDALRVFIDQSTLVKLPERVGTLVVGNPLIADVAIQQGGTIVVTGKGYGATNLIALDRQGNVLLEKTVQVEAPRESVVTVFRGVNRETYSCLPNCERRITLGDAPAFFTPTLGQTTVRNSQAQAVAPVPR